MCCIRMCNGYIILVLVIKSVRNLIIMLNTFIQHCFMHSTPVLVSLAIFHQV